MDTKEKLSFRNVLGYLLIGISVIMLGKSLMLCFGNDIWYDELFTVGMIEHSYGDLVAFTAKDVHPPLYYCIVKFVVELCKLISADADTVIIAKTVSVLPYFILLLYSVTFIRKRFGIFTGGLFLFCVITMPQLSSYTVEVRMYGWALLFVTAAFLHAYGSIAGAGEAEPDADREPHKLTAVWKAHCHDIALVLYGLAAAYTHYFACVAVIMVYLYVLAAFLVNDRSRIRVWLLWVAVSIVGYVPWLYTLYKQIAAVNENYWILPLSWRSLGGCVKFVMKPAFSNDILNTVLAAVLFAVSACIFIRNVVKLYHNRRDCGNGADSFGFIIAGIGVPAGLVLFGFAASIILRPIFVYRYMIPALGCFWLSLAVGLGMSEEMKAKQPTAVFLTIKRKVINGTVYADKIYMGITTVVCALIILIGLRDYRAFMGEEEYRTLMMKDTAAALNEISAADILIFNFDQVQMVTGFYLDNDSYLWYGQPEALVQEICGDKGALDGDITQIKEWIMQGKRVWFIGSFNSREDIIGEWRAAGITVEETGSYLLERYWFNLYELTVYL